MVEDIRKHRKSPEISETNNMGSLEPEAERRFPEGAQVASEAFLAFGI